MESTMSENTIFNSLSDKYPDIRFELYPTEKAKRVYLTGFIVPYTMRGQGVGSNFMEDLIKIADDNGYKITLTPSDSYGGNVARLKKFYKEFGFVDNKGQDRDFSHREDMYKDPKGGTALDEEILRMKSTLLMLEGKKPDPKQGTGKKPKGSDRRLYTDEDPSDTVSVKFRTKEDIVDTLNKESFKSKSHKRQSQIINLIHQRVRAAYQNANDPETKKRLKRGLDYIENEKEKSKEKTIRLQKENDNDDDHDCSLNEKCWAGYTQKGMKTMFGKQYPNCVKKKKK